MSENVMFDGFVLMGVGMVVVFAFLGLLVVAMNLCAFFFIRFAIGFPEAPVKAAQPSDDCAAVAVAIAAIKARRASIH